MNLEQVLMDRLLELAIEKMSLEELIVQALPAVQARLAETLPDIIAGKIEAIVTGMDFFEYDDDDIVEIVKDKLKEALNKITIAAKVGK